MSHPQVYHLYECLHKDMPYNPAQIDQSTQMQEPDLPEFLYHMDEDENPVPCFAMTNPYEAILTHDPSRSCVRITPDMLQSMKPQEDAPDVPNGIDILYPPDSGKVHLSQVSLWSIMSDRLSYTIHPQPSRLAGSSCMDFSIDRLNRQSPLSEEELQLTFEGIESSEYLTNQPDTVAELNINRSYDDLLDVSTTYLGPDLIQSNHVFNAEPSFPITLDCHTDGELLGGGKLGILLDTGASKRYMSKAFYMRHPHLHKFPKFQSATRHLQVGNGALVPALFVIPLVFKIQGHIFEVYTLVSEIQDKMDLILGVKNIFELEGIVNTRICSVKFLNRSLPIFPVAHHKIKPGRMAYVKVRIPFVEKLSGIVIVKLLYKYHIGTMRVHIDSNQSIIKIINNTEETIHYTPQLAIGIVDIRSLGYYNVSKSIMFFDKRGNDRIPPPPYRVPKLHPRNYYKAKEMKEQSVQDKEKKDLYPWLDKDDPRRDMTDEEILDKYIDLSNSDLTLDEKETLMNTIKEHKQAFSLRDEIGQCPNIKIDIDVIDDSPFFVRPFPIHEEDKPIMDNYMAKLVSLGILTKNNTTHTSPVMLVSRKGTKNKRPVVDFRLLNTRIMRRNTATPLLRDIFKMLGRSKCEVLSCVDLKDAFHSLGLTGKAKEFCGILPYFGSPHYRYEVLPMGLSISPQVWITYIENLLEGIPNRQSYIAIMDDLMLHGLKANHMQIFKQLLVSLILHGLKLSPRKCQLFMKHLVYLGNVFHLENGVITITPMKSRIEAIQKLLPPTTVKECKSFCGMVNYLSLFCKDLQKTLKPIYELTRKEMPFYWTEFHQKAFEQVKELLIKPPVLHLPRPGGRFILYCDTSKTHTGSSLWQMQDGKPRLLGYASKSLPDACKNYSITELEMTGLAINIHFWKHLLLRVEFDCAVDHRALPYIMKSKNLPATGRIIRLLEHLAGYSFNLYYVKGKDMILCDYLSRIAVDNGDPGEVIPISFNALAQYRLAIDHITESFMITHFMVATRSSTSAEGIKLPPVHGAQKGVDPDLKPESQAKSKKVLLKPTIQSPIKCPAQTPVTVRTPVSRLKTPGIVNSPPIVPGSLLNTPAKTNSPVVIQTPAGPRRIPHNTPNQTPVRHTVSNQPNLSPPQLASRKLIQKSVKMLNTPRLKTSDKIAPQTPQPVAPFPLRDQTLNTERSPIEIPLAKPPGQQAPKLPPQQALMPQSNPFDINSKLIPFQEQEVEAIFKTPELDDFLLPPVLGDLITDTTLMHRHLPRQTDIDRIMEQINRKYLTKLQLPCSIRDMQAAYLNSPHFKDIYMAVGMNKMPSKARTARKLESDLMNAVYMIH